jgi:carnitine 3-dehydrogenase
MRTAPDQVKRIACVGTGTVGGGWVAYFLARGKDVLATDPGRDAEAVLRDQIDRAWPFLEEMGLDAGASRSRLVFTADLAAAVRDADFVQESIPDREDLKIRVTELIGGHAPETTVIASSSSQFIPSRIGARCRNRQRCVIGHPFTPPYLLPLVEVVTADGAPPEVMEWTLAFYTAIGKHALPLRKEHEAYIGNHLLRALGAKANELVDAGICTYADIDAVMVTSLGPRWAVMGPAVAMHLAGGKGGYRHAREHFGWRGSEASFASLAAAVETAAGGASIAEIERWRDAVLVDVLRAQRSFPKDRG